MTTQIYDATSTERAKRQKRAAYARTHREKKKELERGTYTEPSVRTEKERRKEYNARYRANNPDKVKARAMQYWLTNKERLLEVAKRQYSNLSEDKLLARRVRCNEVSKRWAKANRSRNTLNVQRYQSRKIRATVMWANEEYIALIYREAEVMTRITGIRHEVDHMVPLRSGLVCGLHCEDNLCIITKRENCAKRHLYWENMPL